MSTNDKVDVDSSASGTASHGAGDDVTQSAFGKEAARPKDDREIAATSSSSMAVMTATTTTSSSTLLSPSSCDEALDTMDACVGCVEGLQEQHDFESELPTIALPEHNVSADEATWMRLQAMENNSGSNTGTDAHAGGDGPDDEVPGNNNNTLITTTMESAAMLGDAIILNLCGSADDDSDYDAVTGLEDAPGQAALRARPPLSPPLPRSSERTNENEVTETNDDANKKPAAATITSNTTEHAPSSTIETEEVAEPTLQVQQCAICLEEGTPELDIRLCHMPCCDVHNSSTVQFCTRCMVILSTPAIHHEENNTNSARVGRCPRCRAWLAITEHNNDTLVAGVSDAALSNQNALDSYPTLHLKKLQHAGECQVCRQFKAHLVAHQGGGGGGGRPHDDVDMCDACFLGHQRPLVYECQQCHGRQRIPHPMYRYQPTLDDFGTVTWACNAMRPHPYRHGVVLLGCQTYTHWRILPSQAQFIPVGDRPWHVEENEERPHPAAIAQRLDAARVQVQAIAVEARAAHRREDDEQLHRERNDQRGENNAENTDGGQAHDDGDEDDGNGGNQCGIM